jgi:subtilisin family serine protease
MKLMRWFNLLLIVALALAFLPTHTASAAPAAVEIDRNSLYVPGEVVVAFTDGLTSTAYGAQANALAGQVGATVVARYYNYALLSFPVDADVPAMVEKVAATGLTLVAQPNYVSWVPEMADQIADGEARYEADGSYTIDSGKGRTTVFTREQLAAMRRIVKNSSGKITAIPTFPSEFTGGDPQNTQGWELINAEVIYRDTTATPAVCVIDTGVDYKHPDLYGRVINGYDFVNNDSLPNDDGGHGTHVAGTIVAKGNNGANTALGISLGKVVAVKVLRAQGWGTSLEIAAGIRYCGNRTDVKVMNMSLGGSQGDPLEYNALYYAIVTKGKLLAAASGNSSNAYFHFPSSWAHPYVDSEGNWDPATSDNEIYDGVISVAAARMHPHSIPVWVDTNNDGLQDADEWYEYDDCAAGFTNYGITTSIVAPGTMIYSTLPASYAFYGNIYYGDNPGYEYYSGTSMATPHVAAAAARLWSVYKANGWGTPTNYLIKEGLVDYGQDLTYAIDPYDSATEPYFDAWEGFNNTGFGAVDEDEDGIYDYTKAPFCWPYADSGDPTNPYDEFTTMEHVYYLDLAYAMDRYMAIGGVADAITSLPLEGAYVRVQQYNPTLKITQTKDTVKISRNDHQFLITNLQQAYPYPWLFGVSKSGYTASYQKFAELNFANDDWYYDGENSGVYPVNTWVSIPPAKDVQIVADWWMAGSDLDLYVWLPEAPVTPTTTSSPGGFVSPGWLWYYTGEGTGPDYGAGSLLTAAQVGLPAGTKMPMAQLNYDGGSDYLGGGYWPMDSLTVKFKPGYSIPFYAGDYNVVLTDYSNDYGGPLFDLDNTLNYDGSFNYPTVRIWYKGVLKSNQQLYKSTSVTCSDTGSGWPTYDFWHVAKFNGSIVTPLDICGDETILP